MENEMSNPLLQLKAIADRYAEETGESPVSFGIEWRPYDPHWEAWCGDELDRRLGWGETADDAVQDLLKSVEFQLARISK